MASPKEIDGFLKQATDDVAVPGVVAMAATPEGILYEGAFGKRSLPDGAPMTLDTVFWIASMTKAVTSVAAMQLVERGKLDLDAPLGGLLPYLGEAQVLKGFDEAGAPRLRPARRAITLRRLLTHTAGFANDIWNPMAGRYMRQGGVPRPNSGLKIALRMPLMADPGERWEYSIATDWVGQAVEAASGQPLDAYFAEHIFQPLGMADTAFLVTPEQRSRQVSRHQRQADGTLTAIPIVVLDRPEFFAGGGGLHSTGPDYLRFLQMLLAGGAFDGNRVLRAETVALMARNQIGDLPAGIMKTVMPELSNDVDFFPGMEQRWGLGFLINTRTAATGRNAGSLAWAGLGNTYYWIDPTAQVTGLIMMQILPFADTQAVDLYRLFETGIYRMLAAG
ncbi:MAG TPA: serine hydrolase domain-containing protein [Stellaceae bacterium]|nr:serine hydrolase domain-containing protein [Stellaceae bacterium]